MHSAPTVATEPHLPRPGVHARAHRRGAAWTGLHPTSSPADSVPEGTCRKSSGPRATGTCRGPVMMLPEPDCSRDAVKHWRGGESKFKPTLTQRTFSTQSSTQQRVYSWHCYAKQQHERKEWVIRSLTFKSRLMTSSSAPPSRARIYYARRRMRLLHACGDVVDKVAAATQRRRLSNGDHHSDRVLHRSPCRHNEADHSPRLLVTDTLHVRPPFREHSGVQVS